VPDEPASWCKQCIKQKRYTSWLGGQFLGLYGSVGWQTSVAMTDTGVASMMSGVAVAMVVMVMLAVGGWVDAILGLLLHVLTARRDGARDARDLWQADRRTVGERRVATLQQERTVVHQPRPCTVHTVYTCKQQCIQFTARVQYTYSVTNADINTSVFKVRTRHSKAPLSRLHHINLGPNDPRSLVKVKRAGMFIVQPFMRGKLVQCCL